MSGNYLLNENMVTFSDMVSTRMLCAPQLNTLEQQVAAQFQKKANIDIYLSAAPVMKRASLTATPRPLPAVRQPKSVTVVPAKPYSWKSLHRPWHVPFRECH